jgi:phosphate-selective porin OprO/OprP
MPRKHAMALGAVVGATLVAAGPAAAQTATVSKQIDALQQQIQQLQQQLQSLQTEVKQSQDTAKQAQAQAAAATAAASAPPPPPAGPHVTQTAGNHFGLASADGKNTVELTGRYQMDYGDYVNYEKDGPKTSPNDLNSGVNARRARIGVTGVFGGDWKYWLIYDFGGSSDTYNPLLSGAGASGIENGYIEYAGIPGLAIDLGYMDTPFSMDEPTGSNDIMFIERSSAQQLAVNMVAGDNRSAFGGHWNNDRAWIGIYATGPTSGALHSLSATTLAPASAPTGTLVCPVTTTKGKTSATCTTTADVYTAAYGGSAEQTGAFGRAAFQVLDGDGYSLHLGGGAAGLIQPAHTSAGVRGVSFSDRPELRIDPTSLIGLSFSGVTNAAVYAGEAAAQFGPVFVQGEYYDFEITRDADPSVSFQGGYIEAALSLTGDVRKYNPANGAYSMPKPANPFGYSDGGFTGPGAWEIAARYSETDLNQDVAIAKGKVSGNGGDQQVYTVGLNWYVNNNVRFDFDYLHGTIAKPVGNATVATGLVPGGQTFDAVAVRSQFIW